MVAQKAELNSIHEFDTCLDPTFHIDLRKSTQSATPDNFSIVLISE